MSGYHGYGSSAQITKITPANFRERLQYSKWCFISVLEHPGELNNPYLWDIFSPGRGRGAALRDILLFNLSLSLNKAYNWLVSY